MAPPAAAGPRFTWTECTTFVGRVQDDGDTNRDNRAFKDLLLKQLHVRFLEAVKSEISQTRTAVGRENGRGRSLGACSLVRLNCEIAR